MRWIPVYISMFFMRIIENVKPYLIRVRTIIRTISGVLSRPAYKESNSTIIAGFMEHDPKNAAMKHHGKKIY